MLTRLLASLRIMAEARRFITPFAFPPISTHIYLSRPVLLTTQTLLQSLTASIRSYQYQQVIHRPSPFCNQVQVEP